eukprot:3930836-Rhodomonas_salina.2
MPDNPISNHHVSRPPESLAHGPDVRTTAACPDKTEEIAKAVKEMAADCTAVITIGGIGPTHDDVTFRAVAEGLGKGLVHNVEMEGFLRQFKRRPSQEEAGVAGPNRADLKWDTQKMCLMPGQSSRRLCVCACVFVFVCVCVCVRMCVCVCVWVSLSLSRSLSLLCQRARGELRAECDGARRYGAADGAWQGVPASPLRKSVSGLPVATVSLAFCG